MNKFIYIFVAIVAISFASCTQERAKEKELKVLSGMYGMRDMLKIILKKDVKVLSGF